jgi:ABC-type polar amino acid transport system ATPase subunit
MSFDIDLGHVSERGPRPENEDFAASMRPAAHEEALGFIAAIADGVSKGGEGRMAAQTSVMSLLEDLHREGTTIVMVTHDPQLAARAQRNVHVVDGQVVDVSDELRLASASAAMASQSVAA